MASQLATREAAPLDLMLEEGRGAQRLPEGWLVGWDCDIGGPPGQPLRVELVALHPAFGIALLGHATWVEEAEARLRQRLAEARFGALFGGHLPILNGTIEPAELPRLVPILVEAFGHLPPLDLIGGDAWVSVVTRLVVPAGGGWTDNLAGLPPAVAASRAEAERTAWHSEPAAVLPLRRTAEPPPEAAEPVQDAPQPASRSRWPWALCAMASLATLLLLLELSYSGGDPAPGAAAVAEAVETPPVPVVAAGPVPEAETAVAMAAGADAAPPPASSAPAGPAPVAVAPAPVAPPVAPLVTAPRTNTAPPRLVRASRAQAVRQVQARPAKAKQAAKPAATNRRETAKRGHARG
ncbi:hypothetical protein [Roseicella aquatilis]|uniref:Uncharacterized protein n=1 Tax=Roseicella aquatilis TaxID=2527868 RepID=A0A4R4DBP4_9PROT|nr:hypothetical protein [Roseicella aquatilis]TCZ57250.1 hypothetical protein EXY23_18110 [Roseicella aquatilis]